MARVVAAPAAPAIPLGRDVLEDRCLSGTCLRRERFEDRLNLGELAGGEPPGLGTRELLDLADSCGGADPLDLNRDYCSWNRCQPRRCILFPAPESASTATPIIACSARCGRASGRSLIRSRAARSTSSSTPGRSSSISRCCRRRSSARPPVSEPDAYLDEAAGLPLALSWGAPEGLAFGDRPEAVADLVAWAAARRRSGCR